MKHSFPMRTTALFVCTIAFTVGCFLTPGYAQTGTDVKSSTESVTGATAETVDLTPQEQLERIDRLGKELDAMIAETKKSLDVVSASAAAEVSANLSRRIELIQSTKNTIEKQKSTLQQIVGLNTQIQQLNEQNEKLIDLDISKPASFLEIDRLREDLITQQVQQEALKPQVEQARAQAKQAQANVTAKQSALAKAEAEFQSAVEEPLKTIKELEWQTAQRELNLAEEQADLARYELQNKQLTLEYHGKQEQFIKNKIAALEQNVVFTREELDSVIQKLDAQIAELQRQITRTNSELEIAKGRLSAANQKLSTAGDSGSEIVEEVKTRQREIESLQEKIESLNKKIELANARKKIWQWRYSIFNFNLDEVQLRNWKTEAQAELESLDNQYKILSTQLSIFQNELVSLRARMDSEKDESPALLKSLQAQQRFIIETIGQIQERQSTIEIIRRIYNRVIAEINKKTENLSLQERIDVFLSLEIYHNPVRNWLYAVGQACLIFFGCYVVRWFLIRRMKKLTQNQQTGFMRVILETVQKSHPFFFLVLAVFVGSIHLTINEKVRTIINNSMMFALIMQSAIWASYFVRTSIFYYIARKTKRDTTSLGALAVFNFISQLVLWSVALLLLLSNFGVDVTALVAGLGVGGIAIALAVQNILGDLFASLSIVLDKPFVVGDFIIFDNFNYLGSVESIGIKTTRIRSLTGEQIICSNNDLLNTRIRNFKRMHERRVVFKLGVVYQTPPEKLEMIPPMIREIIETQNKTRFDRAHFQSYGDFSLNFEIVYYVLTPDYNVYMDIQQNINLEIYRRFLEHNIEFAYPTQTVFLQRDSVPEAEPVQVP